MSSCPRCYNTSCPEPVAVTINDNTVQMELSTERYSNSDFSGTEVQLLAEPVSLFPIQVYVSGVLQRLTDHYAMKAGDNTVVEFTSTLSHDAVEIIYVAP